MQAHILFSLVIIFILAYTHAAPTTPRDTVKRGTGSLEQLEMRGLNTVTLEGRDRVVEARAGLGASKARKSDLELESQSISQSRKQISNSISSLFNQASKLDPASAEGKKLQAQIAAMQEQDKRLEAQSKRIDTQLQAVQTEIESVQKIISKGTEDLFKFIGK